MNEVMVLTKVIGCTLATSNRRALVVVILHSLPLLNIETWDTLPGRGTRIVCGPLPQTIRGIISLGMLRGLVAMRCNLTKDHAWKNQTEHYYSFGNGLVGLTTRIADAPMMTALACPSSCIAVAEK